MIPHIRLANAVRARLFRLLFARRFAAFGRRTLVVAPVAIERPGRIALGDDVYVAAQSCLAAGANHEDATHPALVIEEGCKLGRFNHLYATRRVRLGRKVLTANGVYISDNLHGYRDIGLAVMDQPLTQLSDTEIGDHSWIGHNACVIGARLGRHCIVGANAVVTRDAPDYSVIVGAPARIIRRYDLDRAEWRATEPDGTFLPNQPPAAP